MRIVSGTMLYGQNYFEPNYALKTPGTLEILNVQLTRDATIISASIENLIEGGYFCIDPGTYISDSKGNKLKLSNISGLPLCPDSYRFKKVGELRYLTLTFPPLPQDTEWFNIIEECDMNCMAVYGICLDRKLNEEINSCFRDIDKGRLAEAIKRFEVLRQDIIPESNPMLGSIYLNLISLYNDTDQTLKAEQLIEEFNRLLVPFKQEFIKVIKK